MMELYPEALYNSTGRIEAISKLSEKTGLAERTIRGLLNRPCRYTPGAT
jgi:lambda repressor-like predicted transcriptional regulator